MMGEVQEAIKDYRIEFGEALDAFKGAMRLDPSNIEASNNAQQLAAFLQVQARAAEAKRSEEEAEAAEAVRAAEERTAAKRREEQAKTAKAKRREEDAELKRKEEAVLKRENMEHFTRVHTQNTSNMPELT